MRFKIANFKAANASNSIAIDKFANAVVGDFGLMGDIHGLISASLDGRMFYFFFSSGGSVPVVNACASSSSTMLRNASRLC